MKRKDLAGRLACLLAGLAPGGSAQAHHSLMAEFHVNDSIEIRGTVTEFEWLNPHIWIYLEVEGENGEVEKWRCEVGSPKELAIAGWSREDLPIGSVIRAQANPARDGSNTCSTRNVFLDDGTPVFTRFGNR